MRGTSTSEKKLFEAAGKGDFFLGWEGGGKKEIQNIF
jgi:hypothetical protein